MFYTCIYLADLNNFVFKILRGRSVVRFKRYCVSFQNLHTQHESYRQLPFVQC